MKKEGFSLFLLNTILVLDFCSKTLGQKKTSFQGKYSILSQENLSVSFPMREKFHKNLTLEIDSPKAILSADRDLIKDGGDVRILAELVGTEVFDHDYFVIQCGPAINEEDILDAVAPTLLDQYIAEVEIHDLTFMRCDYKFSYVKVDIKTGSSVILGELVVPSEDLPTAPKQVHLVYGGTSNTMNVMYVTSSAFPPPSVKYWRSDQSQDDAFINIGTSATYNESQMCQKPANMVAQNLFRDPGFTHTVEMVYVVPDTRYFYCVGNDEHGWSKVFTFQSAPDYSRPVRFVVFGDQDIGQAAENTSYYVKKEVEENGSEFTLHIGDFGYAEGKGWVWDRWGSIVSPGAAIAPYMVSFGNHELDHTIGNDPTGEDAFNPSWWSGGDSDGECGVPTMVRWGSAVPKDNHGGGGNKLWYSFDWGNVHVAMMDSEHDWRSGSHQYSWLEADLVAVNRSITPWVIVTSHRNIYSTQECELGNYVISTFMRQALDPLFEKYQVNLVLVAHTHSYERTCLIRNGKCVENGGTQHITVGSGGAGLQECGFSPDYGPYSKAATNQWGYLRVETNQNSITLEFVLDADGSVWDYHEVLPWN